MVRSKFGYDLDEKSLQSRNRGADDGNVDLETRPKCDINAKY